MALGVLYETLDKVPEALHAFYIEQDGKFILDLADDVKVHPKVSNLQTAFEKQRTEAKKAKDELKILRDRVEGLPDDFDPSEYLRLKALEGDPNDPDTKKKDEHLQSQKKHYEERLQSLEKKLRKEIEQKDDNVTKKHKVIERLLVEDGLTKSLVEAGIGREYLKAAKAMLKDSVKVQEDDGEYRAVVVTDMGEEDIPRFVTNWAQSDEGKVFVAKATGSDATGGSRTPTGDNPFRKEQENLTKQQLLIRDHPEQARRLAKAAGINPDW